MFSPCRASSNQGNAAGALQRPELRRRSVESIPGRRLAVASAAERPVGHSRPRALCSGLEGASVRPSGSPSFLRRSLYTAAAGLTGKRLVLSALAVCFLVSGFTSDATRILGSGQPADLRFLVYYGVADLPAIGRYDLVVLDSRIDKAIVAKYRGTATLLAYLSLGEVHMQRAYASEIAAQGLLLGHNRNWPDARFVDLRDERWKSRVLEQLIPDILYRGFHGLFLDTLDDAEYLETLDPQRFAGMTDAAVDLVQSIRLRFPGVPIMVNRGYALLPRIVHHIDMLMGESVRSTYDAAQNAYVLVSDENYQWQRDRLYEARRLRSDIQLFSLDYWTPKDASGINRLYAQARSNGFVPYVATIDLARVVPTPSLVTP